MSVVYVSRSVMLECDKGVRRKGIGVVGVGMTAWGCRL